MKNPTLTLGLHFLHRQLAQHSCSWKARAIISAYAGRTYFLFIRLFWPSSPQRTMEINLAGLFLLYKGFCSWFLKRSKNLSAEANEGNRHCLKDPWNFQVSGGSKDVQNKCMYLCKTWEQSCMQQKSKEMQRILEEIKWEGKESRDKSIYMHLHRLHWANWQ